MESGISNLKNDNVSNSCQVPTPTTIFYITVSHFPSSLELVSREIIDKEILGQAQHESHYR